jgi:NTE family protein
MQPGFTLALGGGGARGSAHIGVIRALEELGLRPGLVVGTSAGAVVGAGYAAGLSAAQMTAIAHGTDVWGTVGRRTSQALFDLRPLLERYVTELGVRRIQDLPLPFVAAAYDLDKGRLIGIDRGPLVEALLRSAAIPIVFRPQANGAHLIVDGGLWESVPVSLARERAPVPVIGVEIMGNKPAITERGPIAWYLRTGGALLRPRAASPRSARRYLGLLLERLAEPATRVAPDIRIVPALGLASPLNFSEIDSLEAAGYRAGMAALGSLAATTAVESHG